jgi:homogentisate 1,2-dioxygenase
VTYYRRVGDLPAKRHSLHRGPDGGRLSEELMGEEGFRGASSLLYHRYSPSAITGVEPVAVARPELTANEPLLPWHVRAGTLTAGGDLVTGRRPLFANADVIIAWVAATASSGLFRDAAGDEVVYVQRGRAVLESVFGRLEVGAGDYVVIPASTTHRWVQREGEIIEALVIEAAGHVGIPPRYRTATGQMREGAPFCERDLRGPTEAHVVEGEAVPVLVRTRSGWSRHCHARHPFDVVAWDGCCYPYAFSVHDFEPIVGRVHQPPPVHQTFEGPGFVICSFVPRPFDFGLGAVKVPYHHANVDSDEVLFYSAGDFMSRAGTGIGPASLTLHPAGFVHGPQPGSVEASMDAERTEETAVMIDTFSPLLVSEEARSVADEAYPWSWSRRPPG